MIKAILAHDSYWGIGKNGELPWPKNSDDLKWFKECTTDSVVVMGRKTWDSLPKKPLPNRFNIVITTQLMEQEVNMTPMLLEFFKSNYAYFSNQNIWIIGGAQLLEQLLPYCDELWLNNVEGDYQCDIFLPKQKITELFYPKTTEVKTFGIVTIWSKK